MSLVAKSFMEQDWAGHIVQVPMVWVGYEYNVNTLHLIWCRKGGMQAGGNRR